MKGVDSLTSYDKREVEIIEKLQQGRSREDMAEDYGYSTKSIYMNDKLARLMAGFSSSNNISQREIVETSIILYLKKYSGSYGKDIENLLNKK